MANITIDGETSKASSAAGGSSPEYRAPGGVAPGGVESSPSSSEAAAADGGGGGRRGGRGGGGVGRGVSSHRSGEGGGDRGRGAPPRSRPGRDDHQRRQQQRRQRPPREQRQRQTGTVVVGTAAGGVDFRAVFHAVMCRGAARYKVHAPGCSCPRVAGLRSRHRAEEAEAAREARGLTAGGGGEGRRAPDDDDVVDDVCVGSFGRLDLLDDASTAGDVASDDGGGGGAGGGVVAPPPRASVLADPFNNLLVIPDTKSGNPSHAYVCTGTDRETYDEDWAGCEARLAREIFGDGDGHGKDTARPFKVSCARCLLERMPNGFVAIMSRSPGELIPVLRGARDEADRKRRIRAHLHADHAHFLCALEVSSLTSLISTGRMMTRGGNARAAMDIARRIAEDDECVDVLPPEMSERIAARTSASAPSSGRRTPPVRIELGHHMSTFLRLLAEEEEEEGPPREGGRSTSPNDDPRRVMAMGYVGGPDLLTLDLPGGKRRLGESTLSCAVREAEEECSLIIDRGRLEGGVPERYGGVGVEEEGGGVGGTDATTDGDGSCGRRRGGGAHGGDAVVRVLASRGRDCHDEFLVMTPPPPLSPNCRVARDIVSTRSIRC